MTFAGLYNMLVARNKDFATQITDYRPYTGSDSDYAIQLWFKNGSTCYVKWVKEINQFVFGQVR